MSERAVYRGVDRLSDIEVSMGRLEWGWLGLVWVLFLGRWCVARVGAARGRGNGLQTLVSIHVGMHDVSHHSH
jgi:hypothetical protein